MRRKVTLFSFFCILRTNKMPDMRRPSDRLQWEVSVLKDGQSREILGSPSREELMAGEATSFADYIEAPTKTAAAYEDISSRTLAVHRLMDQIKHQAGIVYPARKK